MRYTSVACDSRDHGRCDGSCVYHDMDGPGSRYTCECHCHHAARETRRRDEALRKVERMLVTERIDHLYEVTPKSATSGGSGADQ